MGSHRTHFGTISWWKSTTRTTRAQSMSMNSASISLFRKKGRCCICVCRTWLIRWLIINHACHSFHDFMQERGRKRQACRSLPFTFLVNLVQYNTIWASFFTKVAAIITTTIAMALITTCENFFVAVWHFSLVHADVRYFPCCNFFPVANQICKAVKACVIRVMPGPVYHCTPYGNRAQSCT